MINVIKKNLPIKMRHYLKRNIGRVRSYGKPKIFCIGLNKTGTTSLKYAMKELGFTIGHQKTAENFLEDWSNRKFNKLIKYCKSAEFFQDCPFSFPFTYVVLDHEFPNSKFILTVRDSPEVWYSSITNFHSGKWGNNKVPSREDLQNATYIYKGRPWDQNRMLFNSPEDDPYMKEVLINFYKQHNRNVIEYFRFRPGDLLVLNVGERDAYIRLCDFLEIDRIEDDFPWKNKSDNAG